MCHIYFNPNIIKEYSISYIFKILAKTQNLANIAFRKNLIKSILCNSTTTIF